MPCRQDALLRIPLNIDGELPRALQPPSPSSSTQSSQSVALSQQAASPSGGVRGGEGHGGSGGGGGGGSIIMRYVREKNKAKSAVNTLQTPAQCRDAAVSTLRCHPLLAQVLLRPPIGVDNEATMREGRRRVVARLGNGARIVVVVDRVVTLRGGAGSVVEEKVEREAVLVRREEKEFAFYFADDDDRIVHSLLDRDEKRRVQVLGVRSLLAAQSGLPPHLDKNFVVGQPSQLAAAVGGGNGGGGRLELVVFAAVAMSQRDAGTAIVARTPLKHPQTGAEEMRFWDAATDMCSPRLTWLDAHAESAAARCYGGGTRADMWTIVLLAACRKIKETITVQRAQHQQQPRVRAVIVLEGEDSHVQDAATLMRNLLSAKQSDDKAPSAAAIMRQQLAEEWRSLAQIAVIISSPHAFIATEVAERTRLALSSCGERLDVETARLFANFCPTLASNKQRAKQGQQQQQQLSPNGIPPPREIIAIAARITSVQSFVEASRRNKARPHVPSSLLDSWAEQIYTLLLEIINSEGTRRDDAFIALMLLPSLLLPVAVPERRIRQRMSEDRPFEIHKRTAEEALAASRAHNKKPANGGEPKKKRAAAVAAATSDVADDAAAAAASVSGGVRAMALANVLATSRGKQLYETVERQVTMLAPPAEAAADALQRDAARRELEALVENEAVAIVANYNAAGALSETAESRSKQQLARLAEACERLASDFKIRSAVKLIAQTVDNQHSGFVDMPFAEKIAKLEAKFVRRTDTDNADADCSSARNSPPFSADFVRRVAKSMPKQAAACVEHWTAQHLTDAVRHLPAIADRLGEIAALALNEQFGPLVMDILRLGRSVPLPKAVEASSSSSSSSSAAAAAAEAASVPTDNNAASDAAAAASPSMPGVRPITLTSFWGKFVGGCVWLRQFNGRPRLQDQYAIGRKDGAMQVAHAVRAERKLGAAIIRLDIANAFGTARRSVVADCLNEMTEQSHAANLAVPDSDAQDAAAKAAAAVSATPQQQQQQQQLLAAARASLHDDFFDLKRYWNTFYGSHVSKLVVYGPSNEQNHLIEMEEGVKQGDVFSTYFFCLVMDRVRAAVQRRVPYAIIRMYCDDWTISVPPQHARWVMSVAIEELARIGMRCSAEKCKILCDDPAAVAAYAWTPLPDDSAEFKRNRRQSLAELKQHFGLEKDATDYDVDAKYTRRYGGGYDRPAGADGGFGKAQRPDIPAELRDSVRELETRKGEQALFARFRHMIERAPRIMRAAEIDERDADPFAAFFADSAQNEDAAAIAATTGVSICDASQHFVVLGANISDAFGEYNAQQLSKYVGFFRMLERAELPAQLAFTLARVSGFARGRFYATVTPPEHATATVTAMQSAMVDYLERLLGIDVRGKIWCHHRLGLGIPDYVSNHVVLYEESRNAAALSVPQQEVQLVSSTVGSDLHRTAHLNAQANAPWLFYLPRGHADRLLPHEFRLAVAIRCGTLPRDLAASTPPACGCNATPPKDDHLAIIAHAMNCSTSGFTPATRHNYVKFAVARVLRARGLHVVVEPNNYAKLYSDNVKHRPDLLVAVSPPVVTDFVVVQQTTERAGAAAATAAKNKTVLHQRVVASVGHVFFPFALETHGFMHNSCRLFVDAIAGLLPHHERITLQHDVASAVGAALARARCAAVQHLFAPQECSMQLTVEGLPLYADIGAEGLAA